MSYRIIQIAKLNQWMILTIRHRKKKVLVNFLFTNNAFCVAGKQSYNRGQNKWNIWITPSPYFNDAKMERFCSFAPSSLLWGGGGG